MDQQYIQKIKKVQGRRKVVGFTGVVICLLCAIAAYFLFVESGRLSDQLFDAASMLRSGQVVNAEDIERVNTYLSLARTYGERDGVFFGHFLAASVIFGTFSLVFIFSDRKERLLIKYYDEAVSNQSRKADA